MFASSGLRGKLLDLKMGEIDFSKRMLMAKKEGKNKHVWVAFYNSETEEALDEYLKNKGGREEVFHPIRSRS